MIRFIRDIFANAGAVRRPVISFEFFPTKTDEGERALLEKTIPALRTLNPDFCSVTYGAGGGTRDKTLGIVDRIQREHEITAMAHLTCVNATIDETRTVLEQRPLALIGLRGKELERDDRATNLAGAREDVADELHHFGQTTP